MGWGDGNQPLLDTAGGSQACVSMWAHSLHWENTCMKYSYSLGSTCPSPLPLSIVFEGPASIQSQRKRNAGPQNLWSAALNSFPFPVNSWDAVAVQNYDDRSSSLYFLEHGIALSCCMNKWKVKVLVAQSCLTLCEPMNCSLPGYFGNPCQDSPGKNTGVDRHSLLQGIFPTQGSNPGLLHCRQILYCLRHQGSPMNCCINKTDYNPQHLYNLTMAATNVTRLLLWLGDQFPADQHGNHHWSDFWNHSPSAEWHAAGLLSVSVHHGQLVWNGVRSLSRLMEYRTFLVVQWLRLCTPSAGGPGSIPDQGTRSCLPQWRPMILHVASKTRHGQINK